MNKSRFLFDDKFNIWGIKYAYFGKPCYMKASNLKEYKFYCEKFQKWKKITYILKYRTKRLSFKMNLDLIILTNKYKINCRTDHIMK